MGFIKKVIDNHYFRYVFFGGLTTLVNIVFAFLLVDVIKFEVNFGNAIAIIISILFAYFVNARYVFFGEAKGFKGKIVQMAKFFLSRGFTFLVDVAGIYVFVSWLKFEFMPVKIILQFVVLVLNYVFSKLIVFTKKDTNPAEKKDI